MMNVVSLFSGCGGFDLGFKLSGYNIIWANEILKDACESYRLNIGDHIVCEDITKISLDSIPKADIVIGGPPCQSFSLVGKRDPGDIRSGLVWNYLDIINKIKPKIFLMENVYGIKSAKNPDGSKVIDNLNKAFADLGYSTEVFSLNAADYGVPQLRKRVFIVGNNLGMKITEPPKTHSEKLDDINWVDAVNGLKNWVTSFEAISDLSNTNESGIAKYLKSPDNPFLMLMRNGEKQTDLHITPYASAKDMELIKVIPPGGNYQDVPDEISTTRILNFKKTGGRTTTYGRLAPDKPSYTINTHFNRLNVGCNIHYEHERLISLREALRLQSFPDKFKLFSSNKRNYYVQVGNAVPPLLSLAWAKHLKNYL
jgi:DNA (cytosine-5)-methyltransferase 1